MADDQGVASGIGLMGLSAAVLPMMDAVAKWLSAVDRMPPATISLWRFLVQTALLVVIIVASGGVVALKARAVRGNLLRGLLMAAGSVCFFTALKYMPLADATAVFFAEPLMVTGLSAVVLGERVRWRRWTAVGVGFVGTLIVIQPSWSLFGPVSLLPLATALVFSIYMILNRVLSQRDGPMIMQLYAGLGASIGVGATIVFVGPVVGAADLTFQLPGNLFSLVLLVLIGVLGTVGHLLIVRAFKHAPASLLAPFAYLEIVGAALMGLAVFGEFPTPSKWFGILVVIGSGLYLYVREGGRRLVKEPGVAP